MNTNLLADFQICISVPLNQSTPTFPKNEHFLRRDTRMCVCIRGLGIFVFHKIWRALFSCYFCFEIHSFALLTTKVSGLIERKKLPNFYILTVHKYMQKLLTGKSCINQEIL